MSTKIWCAFRFPNLFVQEGLEFFTDHMYNRVCSVFDSIGELSPEQTGVLAAFECGFTFYLHNNYCYLIPYGNHDCENLVKKDLSLASFVPEFVEEFHFQNQCDPPEEMSPEKMNISWDERGEIWEQILPPNRWEFYYRMEKTIFDGTYAGYLMIKAFEKFKDMKG